MVIPLEKEEDGYHWRERRTKMETSGEPNGWMEKGGWHEGIHGWTERPRWGIDCMTVSFVRRGGAAEEDGTRQLDG